MKRSIKHQDRKTHTHRERERDKERDLKNEKREKSESRRTVAGLYIYKLGYC